MPRALGYPLAAAVGALLVAGSGAWRAAGAQGVIRVDGIAYDSLRGRPLSGALVSVEGMRQSATTDSLGRFHLDSLAPGAYRMALFDAALDTVGLSGVPIAVAVRASGDTVRLATPSFATLWRSLCGSTAAPTDSGLVFGTVRDLHARAVAGAAVRIEWQQVARGPGGGFALRGSAGRR